MCRGWVSLSLLERGVNPISPADLIARLQTANADRVCGWNVPELARCQSSLTELSRLLQSLEILQRTQSAPNFTEMQVMKDGWRAGLAASPLSARKTRKSRWVTSVAQTGLSSAPNNPSISFQFLCFSFASVLAEVPYLNGLLVFGSGECLLLPFPCTQCLLPFA